MQNIVTWGQNMSANIEELACFSMGGLFSGVPPKRAAYSPGGKLRKATRNSPDCRSQLPHNNISRNRFAK